MNDKEIVLTGAPGAMCFYQNKLYQFFDKAYRVIQFQGDKQPIISTNLAAWEKPNNCILQDDFIWISAATGLFTLHFDGEKHKILHADTQGWDNVHGLGIYKDYLYAVCDVVKQYDTSSGITKIVNDEDWSHMACGAQRGNSIYLPSKRGPLWRFDMEKNTYEKISDSWHKSLATAFADDQLFIFADGIWSVDCDSKKKRQLKQEDCTDVLFCTSLGKDVYGAKKDGSLWKYNLGISETKIDLEGKAQPTSAISSNLTSIVSWDDGKKHSRLYTVDNGKIIEYCKDGDGNWYKGKFPEITGVKAGGVALDGYAIHVFVQDGTSITEKAFFHSSGWTTGAFKAKGNLVGVSASASHRPQVWVENNGAITEFFYDGNKWQDSAVKV